MDPVAVPCDAAVDCDCLCPQKWGTYTSVASGPCASTKFIAMKTPLSHEVRNFGCDVMGTSACQSQQRGLVQFSAASAFAARLFAAPRCWP